LARSNIYQYLALGDSYTIGEAVAEDERWPAVLARQLAEEGVPMQVTFLAQTTAGPPMSWSKRWIRRTCPGTSTWSRS
jgi:hypothetical protein